MAAPDIVAWYSRREVRQMLGCIWRQNPPLKGPRLHRLLVRLGDLLHAMGLYAPAGTYVLIEDRPRRKPTNRDLASQYQIIAHTPGVLGQENLRGCRSAISAWLRGHRKIDETRWKAGELNERSITTLSAHEIADVMKAAQHLAIYHDNRSRTHTRRLDAFDTLLIELADIFAELTEFKFDRYELGKAARSRFIRFVEAALYPFFHQKDVSPNALYSRWKRLQSRNRARRGRPPQFRAKPLPNRWKNKRKLIPRN
jgi:hypothetical protein